MFDYRITIVNFGKSTYFRHMNHSPYAPITVGAQFGLTIIMTLAGLLLFMLLAIALLYPLFGVSITQLQTADSILNPTNVNAFKFMQIMQSVGLFVVPPVVLGKLFSGNGFAHLKIDKAPDLRLMALASGIIVFAVPVINLIAMLNEQIQLPGFMSAIESSLKAAEKNAETLTLTFMNVTTPVGLMVNLLMMALLPAIGEEFFFRGILQQMIIRWTRNPHWGIIITGFIFSAIHMQFYGFFPRWLLGMLLGYLFLWSGSLWLSIIAHFVNNTIAVVGYYLVNIHRIDAKSIDFGSGWDGTQLTATVISTCVMAFAIFTFYRRRTSVEKV